MFPVLLSADETDGSSALIGAPLSEGTRPGPPGAQ
jgi:hypothetical protein